MGFRRPEPSIAGLEDATERIFGPQLEALGLSAGQITSQNLAELQDSLGRVNDAIAHPESFGTYAFELHANSGTLISVLTTASEGHVTLGVLPLLLRRKKLILERIRELYPQQQLSEVREQLAQQLDDPHARAEVLGVIDQSLAAERELREQLDHESEAVTSEQQRARIQIDLLSKRSEIFKSLLERETVAGAVGAALMVLLGIAIIIAMFVHTAISGVVSDSFLLILGYFFGHSSGDRTDKSTRDSPGNT